MRNCGNGDLKIEVKPQNDRDTARRKQEPVGSGEAMARAGYQTLDQAETGEYSSKERRGLARDANYPRRY